MFVAVILEFWADGQQWVYHKAKSAYKSTAKVPKDQGFTRAQLDRGFNTTGLFAWSRHPNFAGEQAVWVCLYQWCCCEAYTFVNWTFAGAFGYLILFQASTWLTEMISAEKYPEYKIFQQRVGKFLPKGNTKSMEDSPTEKEKRLVEEVRNKSEKDKITNIGSGSEDKKK
jgi:steroid 5-alpha reductase family enzyme